MVILSLQCLPCYSATDSSARPCVTGWHVLSRLLLHGVMTPDCTTQYVRVFS